MTDEMSPEQRRDQAVAAVIAAGGMVAGTDPMASPEAPSTVVAYQINASARRGCRAAVAAVQQDTEVDLSGLVSWQDPAAVLVEDGES